MKRITFLFIIAFLLLLNIVCTKSVSDKNACSITNKSVSFNIVTEGFKTYIIKRGAHYCTPNPFLFTSKSVLTFTAIFDSSCKYKTVDHHNQKDINKLFGFSDCNTSHKENSARVGWRWSHDSLRLFGYVHNGRDIIFQEITTAPIGRIINCRISCLTNQYKFEVNGKTALLPRHCSGNYLRYKLYPYFGGDEVAPQDIKIYLSELDN